MPRKLNMPKQFVNTCQYSIDRLVGTMEHPKKAYDWSERKVCGFPVPNFQRPLKWSVAQQISFIESVWKGYDIGSYMIVKNEYGKQFSGAVIDGQQRLKAIEDYLNDRFEVFGYKYSDLDVLDHRDFENIPFPCRVLHVWDEQELRDTYNRLNFGGVAHNDDEKA